MTVREIDLGDGTRKMLKFEKKDEKKEKEQETKTEKAAEVANTGAKDTSAKDSPTPEQKEETTQAPPQTQETTTPAVQTPLMDKQLAKLETEIAKNREMIKNLEEKVETINKDLDDLVSLYEIVSEQMNPFVGLSKVTRKRLEALEKLTEEFDKIKSRLDDLEILVGKVPASGAVKTEGSTEARYTEEIDKMMDTSISALVIESEIETFIDKFLEEVRNE
ncbi:MAG: hypothetical protein FE037_02420 [Thermoplasmata archaeon]|nr:MAG: hypothetical protein FE042_00405 [Thermoplasmata archaeon]KAA0015235.1 MAG: hypothetical protein FE037_02420 [Thermoplasmata archaeon]